MLGEPLLLLDADVDTVAEPVVDGDTLGLELPELLTVTDGLTEAETLELLEPLDERDVIGVADADTLVDTLVDGLALSDIHALAECVAEWLEVPDAEMEELGLIEILLLVDTLAVADILADDDALPELDLVALLLMLLLLLPEPDTLTLLLPLLDGDVDTLYDDDTDAVLLPVLLTLADADVV